jgi:membrane-bound serine protease (ClpP class)
MFTKGVAAMVDNGMGGRLARLALSVFVLVLMATIGLVPTAHADAPRVRVIEVHGHINGSVASFVSEQLDTAWKDGAAGVILDVDTLSGDDDAANEIKSSIISHTQSLPIAVYVHDHAMGAGAIIPLASKTVVMSPSAILGGAGSSKAKADFKAAAAALGRNQAIAGAFVSADAPLPSLGVANAGDSLTMTAQQAQTAGFATAIATDYPGVLTAMGQQSASIETAHFSAWVAFARWIVLPWATILLLALGIALIIVELLTLHTWGLAGIAGGLLLALIFAAHIAVGHASYVGILLVLGGVVFLLFETHLFPGHGVSAIIGLGLVGVGMYFALGGAQNGALYAISGSLLMTVGILVAFFIYLPRSRVWNKIGQPMMQTATQGYVSSEDYTGYLGSVGEVTSDLRPSGIAEFQGVRMPVVSEGAFISAGTHVEVVLVQGSRIVVAPAASVGYTSV